MGKRIPVRTYNDWDRPPPGFLEIDLVAHCGGPLSGSFIHSLVATDICTGWTEAVPLLAREQSLDDLFSDRQVVYPRGGAPAAFRQAPRRRRSQGRQNTLV